MIVWYGMMLHGIIYVIFACFRRRHTCVLTEEHYCQTGRVTVHLSSPENSVKCRQVNNISGYCQTADERASATLELKHRGVHRGRSVGS